MLIYQDKNRLNILKMNRNIYKNNWPWKHRIGKINTNKVIMVVYLILQNLLRH